MEQKQLVEIMKTILSMKLKLKLILQKHTTQNYSDKMQNDKYERKQKKI